MRPLEILLSVTNVLAFTVLAVPRLRAVHWIGYLALVTVLVAVIQVLVEGQRWQMVPAYVLTGAFFLVWLLQNFAVANGIAGQSTGNRFVTGLAAGLGIVALAVSIALPVILPIFRFPPPGGPYRVGTMTYYWVDSSRREIFNADPNARRELMAQVWYPAGENLPSARAPYVEGAQVISASLGRLAHLPKFTFEHFKYVTTNAVPLAPVATDQPKYPVLIFLEGFGGFRQMNTFQIEELVSHGYIVAGIDQPYAAASVVFPDGHEIAGWTRDEMLPFIRQSSNPVENAPALNGVVLKEGVIPYFAQDVSFTIDQLAALNNTDPNGILAGRLDLERLGVFGISLGAIVAGEAGHTDSRLKACLMMDAEMTVGVAQAGLRQPAIWLTRPADSMRLERERAGGWPEDEIRLTLDTMRAAFEKSQPGNGYYVQVPGMFHLNYTDTPYYSPIAYRLGFAGPVSARRGFEIINAYSLAFFDKYLKGQSEALLDGPPEQYPELLFEKR